MRIVFLLLFIVGLLGPLPSRASDSRPGCDSCLFKIDSLEKPYDLHGKWLFTRKDNEVNKAVNLDTSDWELINAPGPWFWVDPGKTFTVGWYRGVFEFPPAMIGQKVVVFMDNYLSRTNIYVDGDLLFKRPDPDRFQSYYPIQSIPASFTITKTRHVFTFRIQGYMMSGPYQLPLKIQKFDEKAQQALSNSQIWGGGGQIRMLAAYVALAFGFFFLLVYFKTREFVYLMSSATAITFFPFFAFTGDSFINFWGPETSYFLHYLGLYVSLPAYMFFQCFTGFRRKLNKYLIIVAASTASLFPFLAFVHQDATITLVARYLCIGFSFFAIFCALHDVFRAFWKDRQNAALRTLLIGLLIVVATASSDGGIDFGLYASYGTLSIGFMGMLASILWVSSVRFANTFLENKALAKDLKVMNDNLENLVTERTVQLRQKTNDIQAMLENMPQGVLTVMNNDVIHPEYSDYLETIFETQEIAGSSLMLLVFSKSSLGSDLLSQVEAAISSCIGEDKMNYEFNSHLLVSELDKIMPDGSIKSLELSWSPICDENDTVDKLMLCVRDVTELKRLASEAGAQKRELEIIGEILAVSQEKFQEFIESSYKFVTENEAIIRSSSEKSAEVIGLLFRNMHTIKGNARTYGLLHMTNVVHETEQIYDELRKDADKVWQPEALLEQLAQVRSLMDEYHKINDITLGRKGPGRRGQVERFLLVDKDQVDHSLALVDAVDPSDMASMHAALVQVRQTLRLIGTEKIETVLAGVTDSMASLAKELGKEPPTITIQDHGIFVRNHASGLLKNVYMHLFRNSMDHGLETAEVRLAAGKEAAGHIQLNVTLEENTLTLRLSDDGRGLAVARIRQTAKERGLLTDQVLTPEDEAMLIFASGFSTAEKVTEVSGRGVGMDAVRGFLQEVGGDVHIRFLDANVTAAFRAFELVITLPGKFAVQSDV